MPLIVRARKVHLLIVLSIYCVKFHCVLGSSTCKLSHSSEIQCSK